MSGDLKKEVVSSLSCLLKKLLLGGTENLKIYIYCRPLRLKFVKESTAILLPEEAYLKLDLQYCRNLY